MPFSVDHVRSAFPVFQAKPGLVYFDSAATSQRLGSVLEAMHEYNVEHNGNVHRGMHGQAEAATVAYEAARVFVRDFLHARHASEIVFTKNATEALNLVAESWGRTFLTAGDVVVLSIYEHHSNIVPWLQLKESIGIEVLWIDCDEQGALQLDQLVEYCNDYPVKLVSVTGVSNVTGQRTDLAALREITNEFGALLCIDAAQLVAHTQVNVQEIDCDFLAFSGHKIFGPTGIGVLYGKRELLESMPPFLGGGSMVHSVSFSEFSAAEPPQRFEAGTPPIAEAIGLSAAIDWLNSNDRNAMAKHEEALLERAHKLLRTIDTLSFLPMSHAPLGCVSFVIDGVHAHDLTDLLGTQSICLRAGHHCAQPLHDRFDIAASTRLSVAPYNTLEEIDTCVDGIVAVVNALKGK